MRGGGLSEVAVMQLAPLTSFIAQGPLHVPRLVLRTGTGTGTGIGTGGR